MLPHRPQQHRVPMEVEVCPLAVGETAYVDHLPGLCGGWVYIEQEPGVQNGKTLGAGV